MKIYWHFAKETISVVRLAFATKKLQDHLKEFNDVKSVRYGTTGSEVIRILLFNFIWHISLGDSLERHLIKRSKSFL